MSELIRRNRLRRNRKLKTTIRIKGKKFKVETEDYGTFAHLFKKYGTKEHMYFCADIWNEQNEPSYRLDSDLYNRTDRMLDSYGKNKAWISDIIINGKKVILVERAK